VRATMDAQVVNEGRHQVGWAAYGYVAWWTPDRTRTRVRPPRASGCGWLHPAGADV
jgi:hypothetical protein